MSRKTFRFLILLNGLLIAACFVVFFFERQHLPPELRQYLDSKTASADEPLTAAEIVLGVYSLVYIALEVAAAVGLYRFRSWARPLYVFCLIFGLFPLPPYEADVGTPFTTTLAYLSFVLSGFVLALLYFSPLGQYFKPLGGVQT